MLEISRIRKETEALAKGLENKGVKDAQAHLNGIVQLDEKRRAAVQQLDELRHAVKESSKEIGALMAQGKKDEAEAAKEKVRQLKELSTKLEALVKTMDDGLTDVLVHLPNVPHPSVPIGKTPEDNVELYRNVEALPKLHAGALPHWELATKHGLIDWELGVKITGAGFPVYIGQGARLQRALITWFLDEANKAGYLEVQPPLLVNGESGFGTGQLPDKDGQMYHTEKDGLYLIPTAEVPITNLFRDEIVDEHALPIKRCGYTPCFRREAGSYGKDVRGLNRLHQFDKVEVVQITKPEDSYATLDAMMEHVSGLLQALGLPYRRLLLCTGDMTFTSSKTIDFEVWSAAQERWLEVSSVSNFETYQANRLKLRYKPEGSKQTVLCHTLNGSALALPRIVAALLENNQLEDGRISVPAVLVPYTGFDVIG